MESSKLARFVNHFAAPEFVYNVISGFLLPVLLGSGVLTYQITVLQKGD